MVPAQIILLGLLTYGVGAVITAYLYGAGRPGQNSLAVGAGLIVTVILDIVLIPPFHATGAAIASAVAYTVNSVVLYWFLMRANRTLGTYVEPSVPRASSEASAA